MLTTALNLDPKSIVGLFNAALLYVSTGLGNRVMSMVMFMFMFIFIFMLMLMLMLMLR